MEALRIGRRGGDLALTFNLPLQRANILTSTAWVFLARGDLDQALKTAHEAVTLLDPGSGQPSFTQAMNFVFASVAEGAILGDDDGISLGRPDEAVRVLERAFSLADDWVHRDPNDQSSRNHVSTSGSLLADILRHSNPRRALSVYDHVLQHMAEIRSTGLQLNEAYALSGSSYALRRLGRPAEARRRLDAAFTRLSQLKLYPTDKVEVGGYADAALLALADHEAETGNVARGIEIYQELLDRARGEKPETRLVDAVNLSTIYRSMAALYRRAGRAELASTMETQRLELWRQWDRKLPNNPFVLRQLAAVPAA